MVKSFTKELGCQKLYTDYLPELRLTHGTKTLDSKKSGKNACNVYLYKFQGQEHQDEFGLNWDSFKWRNYSSDLGRFWVIDPLAEVYEYNSPYAFQENKIGLGSEFEGSEIRLHDWLVREGVSFVAKEVEKKMENERMNDSEKSVARKHLTEMYKLQKSNNKGKAEAFAFKSGLSGIHNGNGDAFRHALFNALNTQVVGADLTKELGLAHENGDPNQPESEKIMDVLNNQTGIEIGKRNPDASIFELASMILDKMEDGEMIKLDSKGNVTKTTLTPKEKEEALENIQNLNKNGDEKEY